MKIIAETKDYLLVHKPAGLAVESRSLTEQDLESMLRGREGGRSYLAVINRLDQVVEGLVLFAKTKKAAADLSAQLQAHSMEKEYLALVEGVPRETEAELTDWLKKDARSNVSAAAAPGTAGAKKAQLSYRCIWTQENRSLLRIRLKTGRHHQIRVQLAHAGLPILGDRKYNPRSKRAEGVQTAEKEPYRYPALCCCGLGFTDPGSGKRMCYRIDPKDIGFLFEIAEKSCIIGG